MDNLIRTITNNPVLALVIIGAIFFIMLLGASLGNTNKRKNIGIIPIIEITQTIIVIMIEIIMTTAAITTCKIIIEADNYFLLTNVLYLKPRR